MFCFQVTSLDVAQGGLGLSCEESSSTIKVWETANAAVRVRSCIVIASMGMELNFIASPYTIYVDDYC